MENQEVIQRITNFGLHHAIKDLPNSSRTVEAFDITIKVLQKQIPTRPNGDLETPWACPNCGTRVFHEQQRMYCRQCGQLIAWDKI